MSISQRPFATAAAWAVAICLALPALADHHEENEPAKWDADRVTKLAVDLAVAVADLRETVRREPGGNLGTLQSRARLRLLDNLRLIKHESRHLASELEAGATRDETFMIVQRIGSLANQATEDARRSFQPEQTLEKITAAGSIWNRIRPYYYGYDAPGEAPPRAGDDD